LKLGELLRNARVRLAAAGVESAALDARLLVEHYTATTRTDALARPDREIADEIAEAVEAALERRAAGEPVHRIIGRREFYGLDLKLSPATLEPRPDTEILVDRMIPRLREVIARHGRCRILDLGTGTGAIALALLSQLAEATAVGADIDPGAVATAIENAHRHGLSDRFEGIVSDWFSAINGKFHAIVSNPPYIDAQEMDSLPPEVRLHDPHKALHGGQDGLGAYRAIAAEAGRYLEPVGLIGVEIGYRQREQVAAVFGRAGFTVVEAAKDLAGHDRALIFKAE
jgi:release factor glutamine methyltransferase